MATGTVAQTDHPPCPKCDPPEPAVRLEQQTRRPFQQTLVSYTVMPVGAYWPEASMVGVPLRPRRHGKGRENLSARPLGVLSKIVYGFNLRSSALTGVPMAFGVPLQSEIICGKPQPHSSMIQDQAVKPMPMLSNELSCNPSRYWPYTGWARCCGRSTSRSHRRTRWRRLATSRMPSSTGS